MTYRCLHNNVAKNCTLLFEGNTNIVVSGNSSIIALENENLIGAAITRIWINSISGDSAYWHIKRGSNTLFVPDSTQFLDFKGNGFIHSLDYAATLSIDLYGTRGCLIIELDKIGTYSDPITNEEIIINNILIDRNDNLILSRLGEYIVV